MTSTPSYDSSKFEQLENYQPGVPAAQALPFQPAAMPAVACAPGASDGCASAGCESSSTLLQRASARPSSSPQRSASPAKAQSWSAVEAQASGIVAKKSVAAVN